MFYEYYIKKVKNKNLSSSVLALEAQPRRLWRTTGIYIYTLVLYSNY